MHLTLAEQLVDLHTNAVSAGAGTIWIEWHEGDSELRVLVQDDGRGMDPETRAAAIDPFYSDGAKHPDRHVGLGLPFLIQVVDQVDGEWLLESELGVGTKVGFSVPRGHVDLPAVGDLVMAFVMALATAECEETVIVRSTPVSSYTLRQSELRGVLGDLQTVEGMSLLRTFVANQEDDVWRE